MSRLWRLALRGIRSALWAITLWLTVSHALHAQPLPAPQLRPWAEWNSTDWLAVGAVAGATAGSFLVEERVRAVFQDHRSGAADLLERVGWWYGTPLFAVPVSLLTWGAGAAFDAEDVRDTGAMMSGLLLSALLVQQPLRIAVGRARPLAGEGHLSFQPFTFGNEYASFVSGHSWIAFGISNIVARQIDQTWAYVSLYSLATITALSRMYADAHWLTDVLLGSIVGYAISTAIWNEHRENSAPPGAALRAPPNRWLVISLPL
jgi:membrane-associated phospholipid phosphatase